jgi:hypothetical protein
MLLPPCEIEELCAKVVTQPGETSGYTSDCTAVSLKFSRIYHIGTESVSQECARHITKTVKTFWSMMYPNMLAVIPDICDTSEWLQ